MSKLRVGRIFVINHMEESGLYHCLWKIIDTKNYTVKYKCVSGNSFGFAKKIYSHCYGEENEFLDLVTFVDLEAKIDKIKAAL